MHRPTSLLCAYILIYITFLAGDIQGHLSTALESDHLFHVFPYTEGAMSVFGGNFSKVKVELETLEKWEGIFQSKKSQGILNRLEKSGNFRQILFVIF